MKKPYVVGIAGGSASGKSTFTEKLEHELSGYAVLVLHMDSYFKPEDELPLAKSPVGKGEYRDYNCPDSFYMDRLVSDLKSAIAAGEADVIIVEGLLTLWKPEICRLLDLKLFVDCPADERIVRRLKRNMGWGLTFDQVAEPYLDLVRFRHSQYVEPSKWNADLILNGSNSSETALKVISEKIKAEVKKG